MKKIDVREAFRKDFLENYYQFDGKEIFKNIKSEILYNDFMIDDYPKSNKVNSFLSYAVFFASAVLILTLFLINSSLFRKEPTVDVDSFFKVVDVDYDEKPVIISSSYRGEELRIYKATSNNPEYYYFFNEKGEANVSHLLFVNKDKSITKKVDITKNFGNLTDLIEIKDYDNIEVVIVYRNNQTFSQFFVAK